MIDRRAAIAGGLFALCDCEAHAQSRPFICAVPDNPPKLAPFVLDPLAGNGDELKFDTDLGPLIFTPYGSAFLQDVWTKDDNLDKNQDRIVLGVSFVDGMESQRAAVREHASRWLSTDVGKYVNFRFDVPSELAHARVTFDATINWSAIGRNALTARTRHTMSFDDVSATTVMHEFGHFLGLQHEHRFPNVAIRWNTAVVLKDMRDRGWHDQLTRDQILSRLDSSAACIGNPNFDVASVMIYPIPQGWASYLTSSGVWRPLIVESGHGISSGDIACVSGLYRQKK